MKNNTVKLTKLRGTDMEGLNFFVRKEDYVMTYLDTTDPKHREGCELGDNWKDCPACRATRELE